MTTREHLTAALSWIENIPTAIIRTDERGPYLHLFGPALTNWAAEPITGDVIRDPRRQIARGLIKLVEGDRAGARRFVSNLDPASDDAGEVAYSLAVRAMRTLVCSVGSLKFHEFMGDCAALA